MYTATKKETIKVMKYVDMSIPRTVRTLTYMLRDINEQNFKASLTDKKLWFTEEIVEKALIRSRAQSMKVGTSTEDYFYIDDWNMIQ